MTFDQLKVFDAVIREGSFKGASERLHCTQPAVSQSIKKMEDEFDIQLFSRENYRPSLTPEGRRFHLKAKEVLLHTKKLEALGKEMGMGQESEISIALDSLCPMPTILKTCEQVIAQFPETKFRLLAEYWSGSMDRLLESEVDLAIAPLRDAQTSQLELVPIMEVTLVPVSAPQFPAANTEHELSLDEVNNYVHVLVQDSSKRTLSPKLKSLLEESNTWQVSDHYTKKEIILAGLGWGRLPEHLITDELECGKLKVIKSKPWKREKFVIHLLRKIGRPIGPVAEQMWNDFQQIESSQSDTQKP
ncbi:MAG: LysR family transcriptional regulator [SAR324 cluster bacterium]|nr:LysR family transcriptional regulator [SAR324 cluster bacterium]MBL7035318.1 LysR family transcriptional regulator [SAR324 cluster bacterium]